MIHEPKIPLHETKTIKNIAEAVSHLVIPDLSQLTQLFIDMRSSVNEDRTALLRQKDQIKAEGYAAAMRLMLPDQDAHQHMTRTYFERLKRSGG